MLTASVGALIGLPAYKTTLPTHVSPEDYLHLEREAGGKHKYFAGEIRAMAGARAAYNQLCFNPDMRQVHN